LQDATTIQPSPDTNALLKRLLEEKRAGVRGGIYHKLQVELTYNSNHMEGSRLTQEQTRMIFETSTVGVDSAGAALRVDDIVEASNHFRCIDYCIENAHMPLDQAFIKHLHQLLKAGTTDAALEWFAVGQYKQLPNEVAGHATTAPENVETEMARLLENYHAAPAQTFESILEFHVAFERVHPFQDGNGRVGRLIMLKECLHAGIVPFVIDDTTKAFYYRGLERWNQERGWLRDTCLAAQDKFAEWMRYFRI
jgi:Fic family protein